MKPVNRMMMTMGLLLAVAPVRAQVEEGELPPAQMAQPSVCADLTATPVTLPNGDKQYPTRPCVAAEYSDSMGDFPLRAKAEAAAAAYMATSNTQPSQTWTRSRGR